MQYYILSIMTGKMHFYFIKYFIFQYYEIIKYIFILHFGIMTGKLYFYLCNILYIHYCDRKIVYKSIYPFSGYSILPRRRSIIQFHGI